MIRNSWTRHVTATACAGLLLLAGCSDDDDGGSEGAERSGDETTTTEAGPGERFSVRLTPESVVPEPGIEGAAGRAEVRIDEEGNQICSAYELEGIEEVINVHLHQGPEGEQGPIIFPLAAPDDDVTGGEEICVEPPEGVITDVLAGPGDHYVNVRSPDAPAGALRGQLEPSS